MRPQRIKVRAGHQKGTGKRCYMIGVPWQIAEVLREDIDYMPEITDEGILFRPIVDKPAKTPAWAQEA